MHARHERQVSADSNVLVNLPPGMIRGVRGVCVAARAG